MKRIIALIITAALLLALCACAGRPSAEPPADSDPAPSEEVSPEPEDTSPTPSEIPTSPEPSPSPSPEPPPGVDRSVELDSFDITGMEIVSSSVAKADFMTIYRSAEDLSKVAEYIVVGEVVKVRYSDENASASTCSDIKISEVLRGDLGVNDIITIDEPGGYIRGDVYDAVFGSAHFEKTLTADDLISFSFYGTPTPEVGEKYILFMSENNLREGTYSLYGAFMGKYYIDGESVYRFVPEDEPWFYIPQGESKDHDQKTVSEVIEAVEKTPAIIDDTYRMFNIE